jgi:hypothetical protein
VLALSTKGRLMRCTARHHDRSTMIFLFEDIGDYRPRPLMQIGHLRNRPSESLQCEQCASVIERIGECHADKLLPDRLG